MPCAVIMAGGQGERFWPMTHKAFPKYRIRLDGKNSLLQATYRRLRKIYSAKEIFVVTTSDHVRMIREELRLSPKQIFIEPLRRNTGPAILLSTALIARRFGPEEVVTFYPADHLIQNEALFKKTVSEAVLAAKKKNALVTIGIAPTFPATGYGYIEIGKKIKGFASACVSKRFVEKPDRAKATSYLKSKRFLWNGGIFTWKAGTFIAAAQKHAPELVNRFDLDHISKSYKSLPKVSVDIAILEKARNVVVVKTRMDWCDMGSWDMFFDKGHEDKAGNLVQGLSQHKDSKKSLLINYSKNPLITLGLEGLIVVQTERGTLICRRGYSEEAARLCKNLPNQF